MSTPLGFHLQVIRERLLRFVPSLGEVRVLVTKTVNITARDAGHFATL
jgi:hypothetical protein